MRKVLTAMERAMQTRGARRLILIALVAGTVALAGCPPREKPGPVKVVVTDPTAGAVQMSEEQLVQAARVEAELVWYTSMPDKAAEALLGAFRRRYPFTTTKLRRAGTFETIRQIEAEIKAGNMRADVLHVLDVGIFTELKRRGELLPYASREEGQTAERYQEPGYWWAMRLVDIGMAYNSNTLPPDRAPKSWTDLWRPEFAGKIGLKDAATAGTAYAEYYLLRERLGTYFWERMARQKPRIYRSADEVMEALLSGEILVAGEMAGYATYGAAQAGRPIVGVWPEDGVPFIPGPIAIMANCPHPYSARLFVDFALSSEGQQLTQQLLGTYSARNDVAPLKGRRPLSSIRIIPPSSGWEDYLQKQAQLQGEFDDLFRPGTE